MQSEPDSEHKLDSGGRPVYERSWILNFSLVVYAVLLLISTAWCLLARIDMMPLFNISDRIALIGVGAGVSIALIGFFLIWISHYFNLKILSLEPFHKILYEELAPMFRHSWAIDLIAIAFVSGFCEEVLFRGAMQSQCGLAWASLIFGLMHCPSLRYLPYGIWATFAGLVFGYLKDYSGSLWVPIIAHIVNNTIGLFYLRHWIGKQQPPAPPTNKEDG